ncbi:MAG: tRNA (adenosine(37)-N6)-threonylcarbamoyltransferase complex transferase subunit TsaD, partial [Clostridia bacterium]|nr:tRNA (adenosine(37)-N6)-threonylcarbamoyltransferase complex transferase subunit TsaD [Clostridia bacterium]
IALAGGVAANSHLRAAVGETAQKYGARLFLPPLSLCGDNAAMIASQAYYEYLAGNLAGTDLNAYATKAV